MVEDLRSVWENMPWKIPMQSFAWARSCAAALANDGLLRLITTEPPARAIAALIKRPGSPALFPLGHETGEPTEFAYGDVAAVEELAESIARLREPLSIPDMYADSAILASLRRAARRRLVTHPTAGHPWLELDDTWLEPESHLNAGRRSDLRRARRNAAKLGPVCCEFARPAPAALAAWLRDAFRVEAAGWKGVQGSALAIDPKVGSFYAQFAQAACQGNFLRIGLLRIGDQAAAMQLAVEQDGCYWLLKMGFDEAFARFSPGSLLLVESLRRARERGCRRYELMGRSEMWNRIWTPQLHEAITLYLAPASVRGHVSVLAGCTVGAAVTALRNRTADYSLGRRFRRALVPIARFAGRSYIAGPELKDALASARAMAARGRGSTIGYWDDVGTPPADVLQAYLESAQALRTEALDSYISIKVPSLRYSEAALSQLVAACEPGRTRIHFDSLALDTAEPTRLLIDRLLARYANVSCTLPGRWKRSLKDADWAIDRGLAVRVVKGQWVDPGTPWLDPHQGFLDVIRRLAGQARAVAVATHCPVLAASSLELLLKAGTPCELELLLGLSSHAVLRVASTMGVRTRIYVPYGYGWLPYSLLQVRRNPRILWRIAKDVIRNRLRLEPAG